MDNNTAKIGLNIADLTYLHEFAPENSLVGGCVDSQVCMTPLPYADAQGNTTALPGLGTADAFALALGSSTKTEAQTSVEAMIVDDFYFTTADAMASAYAKTSTGTYRADYSSLAISSSNSSEFKTTI